MNKAEDIEQLIYRELPPDRYCYIHNFIVEKDKEIERLNNIINELEKVLYKRKLDNYDIYTANVLCDLQSDFNEILQELERSDKE